MADGDPQSIEAWNTTVRLAAAIGRLKIGSNLKAAADAQGKAFELAGVAAGLIAEAAQRHGPGQAGLLQDARGALAQGRSWIHVLAAVTNEQDSVFGNELDLLEQANKQIGAFLRSLDRPTQQVGGPRPQLRPPGPGPRGGGPRGGAGGPR